MAPEFTAAEIREVLAHAREKDRHDKRWARRAIVAVVLLAGLGGGFLIGKIISSADEARAETASIAVPARDLATDVIDACSTPAQVEQLRELGIPCTKAADTRDTIDGADSTPPSSAYTQAPQVRYAPVSAVRLANAVETGVATYCGSRNECTPPPPEDGQDGRSVTQAQLDSTLLRLGPGLFAQYCQTNSCRGQDGESVKGDTGERGPAAPRIVDIACEGTTGRFVFDDGNTIDVEGMCAAPLIPAPDTGTEPEPVDPAE